MGIEVADTFFSFQRFLNGLPFRIGVLSGPQLCGYLCAMPRGVLESMRRRAFRRVLRLAANKSPFYGQRLRELGVNFKRVASPEELGDFYVTSELLRQSPESLLCEEPEVAIESSGTTGHAVRLYTNHRELEYNARQGLLLKAIYNVSKQDRVVSTFDYGFCLDGLLVQKTLAHWKVFSMCVGRVDPSEICRRMPDYGFNIVMSGTPWLARFTEVAEAEGRPYPLKLLLGGGGGGITQRTRRWIENFWEAPLCMTYGLTEAATILGFECLQRDGYHVNEFDFYVEILDRDPEGYGEVVLTTVSRSVMPLIRYRTRDVAKWIDGRCRCGLPFRRLSPLRGRSDEILASVWGNVHPEFFERILGQVPGVGEDWQVALQERSGKQTFVFRLELQNGAGNRDEAVSWILRALETENPLAMQAYMQKLAGIDISFVPKGSLRKSRKLLRLVDERRESKRSSATKTNS